MKVITLLLLALLPISILSQDSCACCTFEHTQFHFWLGEWNVTDSTGKVLGTNTLTLLQDRCVMREEWTSASPGYSGTSYNYYDNADSTWNQLWVDNQGGNLNLKGCLVGTEMVLRSKTAPSPNGNVYNEITWTPNADGSVTQSWAIRKENDDLVQMAFVGIYRRNR